MPPNSNELELSLFGPGVGECAVLHLGDGCWMVVDSCLSESGDTPIALDYLRSLGVDTESQVRLIVISHWHDDHIKGMGRMVRACPNADVACSAAMACEEFFRLVASGNSIPVTVASSGIDEFSKVLEALRARPKARKNAGFSHWAQEGSRIYTSSNPCTVEVHALSPSAQAVTDSKHALAQLMPQVGKRLNRYHSVAPNSSSVVLQVKTPAVSILLGGDLETGDDSSRGWHAVVSSRVRPAEKSLAYKTAHHGSDNADHPGIWTELLLSGPIALLTPYARGPKPRPSSTDVARLKGRASHVYCTVVPPVKSPPKRDSTVERTMKEVVKSRMAIERRPGHIRMRVHVDGADHGYSLALARGAREL